MPRLDPFMLAERQIANDRARTARFPHLFDRKLARMLVSPLAFLRGAAPLFYELLAERPELTCGAPGEGVIVGDLHVENFGAYRPDPDAHAAATFDLNDFDDAVVGPWRLDLLRLATSVFLAAREIGTDGARAVDLVAKLLDAYVDAAFGARALPPEPPVVARLVAQAASRSKRALLDGRTTGSGDARRFVRGERYEDLPASVVKDVPKAMKRYAEALGAKAGGASLDPKRFEVMDAALRIAGTGSLGALRVAVLVRGRGKRGAESTWVFDMKEQGVPSARRIVAGDDDDPAGRVAAAFEACLPHPPRLLGTSRLGRIPVLVRKLTPQEDKLDLRGLHDRDLDGLAAYLGALVGAAHARGARGKRPRRPWSEGERAEVVERAITLAGIHEGAYLALCKLARASAPPKRRRA